MATRRTCTSGVRLLLIIPALATIALLAGRTPAAAQLVTGTVLDESTEQGIAGATIELTDTLGASRGSAVADTAGEFRIVVPQPGYYRLRVSHIAYASTETATINAALGVQVKLELRMSPSAVPLEPLRVVGRSGFDAGWLQEYYDRATMTRRSGVGRVFFRDEVERANVPAVSWFLNYLQPRGRCRPTILLDGLEVDDVRQLDAMLQPFALEGVELYNNRAFIPPRYANRGYCAVAMFWTRRDMEGGRPFTWKRLLAVVGIVAGIVLLAR